MEEMHDLLVTVGEEPVPISVRIERYTHGGGLAVQLVDRRDGEPYATISVNVEGAVLDEDEFVFKTYSENEGLLEAMLDADLVELTGRSTNIGPICRLLKAHSIEKKNVDFIDPPPPPSAIGVWELRNGFEKE